MLPYVLKEKKMQKQRFFTSTRLLMTVYIEEVVSLKLFC